MAKEKKHEGFERDEDGDLVCGDLAGQDYRACNELRKKESIESFPRDDGGNLECERLAGEEKTLCRRQKASESARKSIGMTTEGDE